MWMFIDCLKCCFYLLKNLSKAMERIESGGANDLIDVWLKNKYYIYIEYFLNWLEVIG